MDDAADAGGEGCAVPKEAVPRRQGGAQGELQGRVLRREVIGPRLRLFFRPEVPVPVQRQGVFIEAQLVPLRLPQDQGLVVLRMADAAGKGQGVPRPEGPGRAGRAYRIGPGGHPGVGPAAEGRLALPGILHAAEFVGGDIIVFLVREYEDVPAHGGKDLFPRRYASLPHPVIVESRSVGPPGLLPGADAAGILQGRQQASRAPGRQQRELPPGQVFHPPERPVPGSEIVIQPPEGHLHRRVHDAPGGHFRQLHIGPLSSPGPSGSGSASVPGRPPDTGPASRGCPALPGKEGR